MNDLHEARLAIAVAELAEREPRLGELANRNGLPPGWHRPPGFATLVHLVLEQQVSLASARAAFDRLTKRLGTVEPEAFLELNDEELRSIGFSRQKAGYCRGVAAEIAAGDLDLLALTDAEPSHVRSRLLTLRGVGPWTAECYLLFVHRHPDAWPTGDRALYVSMAKTFDLAAVPDRASADAMAERWRPWRSVAARMLWHDYLGGSSYRPA